MLHLGQDVHLGGALLHLGGPENSENLAQVRLGIRTSA